MSSVVGIGDFVSWQGGCMLIGQAVAVAPLHAHHAIQIAFGLDQGIRFRENDEADWTAYDGVVISSRQPHSMDATTVRRSAVIFVEPETPEGRALAQRFAVDGVTALSKPTLDGTDDALFESWRTHRNGTPTIDAAQGVVRLLSGGSERVALSDERIVRAVSYIASHLEHTLTLEEVANEACLSPSRFRHLFVEQTGTAFRPYVLWRRFLLSWDLISGGHSLSTAAHAAGFADAAHLTRTSHRMFGFAPSALQIGAQ